MEPSGPPKRSKVKTSFKVLHGTICFFLMLLGLAILAYSIYLLATNQSILPDLNYQGNRFVNALLSTAIIGVIVGAAIVILSLIGLIAFNRGCCGVIFGIVYTLLLLVLLVILVFVAVVTLLFATHKDGNKLRTIFDDAWKASVNDSSFVQNVCDLEKKYSCSGFDSNDCSGGCETATTKDQRDQSCSSQQKEVCPFCPSNVQRSGLQGCYEAVVNKYSRFYLPAGIVSSVAGALVVLDILAIWVL